MKHTVLGGALAALTLLAVPATAAAAAPAPKPIKLMSAEIRAIAPVVPQTPQACGFGSATYCGGVEIQARFTGLAKVGRPADPIMPGDGELTGTVHVSRTYGCRTSSGKRLWRYDRTVRETARLSTPRGFGYRLPDAGVDEMTVGTYAFLADKQPRNCPSGTQPVMYSLKAGGVELTLDSHYDGIADRTYPALEQRVSWKGAVPTPTA